MQILEKDSLAKKIKNTHVEGC